MTMKNKLVDYIRKSFRDTWLKNQGDPSRIVSLMDKINPNALLIGFGRRFATYKRAHLLFIGHIVDSFPNLRIRLIEPEVFVEIFKV